MKWRERVKEDLGVWCLPLVKIIVCWSREIKESKTGFN